MPLNTILKIVESVLRKKIAKVIGYGLLTGFIGGLAVFFLMLPIGVLLHVMGIKVLLSISKGGIFSLRYTLIAVQLAIAAASIGYFAWKEFRQTP
ncbi:MAG: hypothetical protein HQL01_08430 [Nitrospirae bacterium]|nr:hypothetical protein [Nitrospirota bacterium]